ERLVIATLLPWRPTPIHRTRASVVSSLWGRVKAPSVNTWISARGSAATRARAVRTASTSRVGRSRGSAARMAASARSRSRASAAVTFGCTPASMTITSAPSPSPRTSEAAPARATSKREGDTSCAFIEAEVSSTTTTLRAPCPITVATGRASARASASSARSWSRSSGSRGRRWEEGGDARWRSRALQSKRGRGATAVDGGGGASGSRAAPAGRTARTATVQTERGSSCDHAPAQLGQDERLDRRVGGHAVVADLLGAAERLDAVEVLAQTLAVRAHGVAVHRELTRVAGLAVDQTQVARQLRVHLLRRQHVAQVHVEAPLEERGHAGLVAGRVEEVRDHDRQARLPRARGVVGQRLVEARAAGGADRGEKIDQAGDLVAPPRGRPALGDPLAQHAHADPLQVDEPDEAERG